MGRGAEGCPGWPALERASWLLHQTSTAQQRGDYSQDELSKTVVTFIVRALEPPKK
jgi:hypothetical protein